MIKRFFSICLAVLFIFSLTFLGGCDDLFELVSDLQEQVDTLDGENTLESTEQEDAQAVSAQAEIIPFEVLMGFSEYVNIQLSSDGTKILYRHMTDFVDDVIVEDWKTGEKKAVVWPNVAGIPRFYYAPDAETVLFFVDNMGDENFGIYTSNIYTGETQTLFEAGENDCIYVSNNESNDQEIYIMKFNFNTSLNDLYLLNYVTGDYELVMENTGDIMNFVFDNDGSLRGVVRTDEQAGIHYWMKKDLHNDNTEFVQSEWEEVLTWGYEDASTSGVFGFMQDDVRLMYIDTANSNTSTLYTYNVDTEQTEQIYNHPDYDIEGAWTDIAMDEVVAVSVYSQKIEWYVLDESFTDDYDILAGLEKGVFNIVGSSDEDEYWLVQYVSDIEESDYYIYDMSTQETTFLFNARQELSDYEFAPVEPIVYTASDGLTIEGYATFPLGEKREDLPTVVVVHGGPWTS